MKISRRFLLLVVIFYFGDLFSTWYMLSNGWYETNSLGMAGMVLAKTILLALIYLATPLWDSVNKHISLIVYGGICIASIWVVMNNLDILRLPWI